MISPRNNLMFLLFIFPSILSNIEFVTLKDKEGTYILGGRYSRVTLGNIHWKYDFIFAWESYYETFKIKG